ETIYIALIATMLSIPPALILSFFTARNFMKENKFTYAIYYILRIILNFVRSIEPLIWAIIFSVWVGIGPFAGMLALMINTIASNARLYSEAIESIEQGPVEAISATGANKLQMVWHAIIPQIILPFLSYTIYWWDINVRMATIIGLVGGGGIGNLLMQYQGLAKWREVGLIVIMIAFVVWIMDYMSARIRETIY
ncbi:MAG: phosphonate ABC transporter, permease protein PhnE, partial [Bacteroidetes bacterium]|nr:phosphonate ABC transporter, permease protein PhnE [Bacteroidota bacterium]